MIEKEALKKGRQDSLETAFVDRERRDAIEVGESSSSAPSMFSVPYVLLCFIAVRTVHSF